MLQHFGRLAGVLLGEHRLLALDHRGVEPAAFERERAGGGDVHGDLPAERGQRVGVAGRFERDDHADAAEAVDDLAVDIMADRAVVDMQAAARRSVMFSPMVAMALAIASATVPPPG